MTHICGTRGRWVKTPKWFQLIQWHHLKCQFHLMRYRSLLRVNIFLCLSWPIQPNENAYSIACIAVPTLIFTLHLNDNVTMENHFGVARGTVNVLYETTHICWVTNNKLCRGEKNYVKSYVNHCRTLALEENNFILKHNRIIAVIMIVKLQSKITTM